MQFSADQVKGASVDSPGVTGLMGAVIGGVTVLGGNWLTQRGERRRAYEDRVWALNAQTYVETYRWSLVANAQVSTRRARLGGQKHTVLARLPDSPALAVGVAANLAVFGAESVFETYTAANQLRLRILMLVQESTQAEAESELDPRQMCDECLVQLGKLRNAISRESRGG